MELRIDTAEAALALLAEGWPTRALSLVDDDALLPCFGAHHLVLRFHDIDDAEVAALAGFTAPTRGHVRDALAHCAGLGPDERVLIHCHAGISRSPAMAIGVLVQAGASPAEALAAVARIRPHCIPNRLVIRYLDEALGLRGTLVEAVRGFYAARGGIGAPRPLVR